MDEFDYIARPLCLHGENHKKGVKNNLPLLFHCMTNSDVQN